MPKIRFYKGEWAEAVHEARLKEAEGSVYNCNKKPQDADPRMLASDPVIGSLPPAVTALTRVMGIDGVVSYFKDLPPTPPRLTVIEGLGETALVPQKNVDLQKVG